MRLRPPLAVGALAAAFAGALAAAPLPQERVLDLCAGVEGITHCGRRIEAEQLKALPDLAVRDGDTLRVKLFPSGTREFADTATAGSDYTALSGTGYHNQARGYATVLSKPMILTFTDEPASISWGEPDDPNAANGYMRLTANAHVLDDRDATRLEIDYLDRRAKSNSKDPNQPMSSTARFTNGRYSSVVCSLRWMYSRATIPHETAICPPNFTHAASPLCR